MKTLNALELHKLTGYKQGSRQVQWVRDYLGLEPIVNAADGRPQLTEYIIEQAALARRVGGAVQAPANCAGVSLASPRWRKAA